MVIFFSTKYMANDDFSKPPRRADSKNPIFIFYRFLGLGHLQGPGVSLGRILGVPSIEPFLGEGGRASQGALSPPPPPELKARLPQSKIFSGASQFRPKTFFGASNNSGSPEGGEGVPPTAPPPPPTHPPLPPPSP